VLFNNAVNCGSYIVSVIGDLMSLENVWNSADREKSKYSERNLSQCQFVDHKSHIDWSVIELGPLW
jgi:hypothetical protein